MIATSRAQLAGNYICVCVSYGFQGFGLQEYIHVYEFRGSGAYRVKNV